MAGGGIHFPGFPLHPQRVPPSSVCVLCIVYIYTSKIFAAFSSRENYWPAADACALAPHSFLCVGTQNSTNVMSVHYPVRPWKETTLNSRRAKKKRKHTQIPKPQPTCMLLLCAPIARLISKEDRRRRRRLLRGARLGCHPYHITTACCWIKERAYRLTF